MAEWIISWQNCDCLNKYTGDIIGGEQTTPNRKNAFTGRLKIGVRWKAAH